MKAAVVTDFAQPPRYTDFDLPEPADGQTVVDVLAAALHPRVRSQAANAHYTSVGELPLVPGVDGVVRGPGGELRYAMLRDVTLGAMADRTIVDLDRTVVLPAGADPVRIAAAMNPALSSWVTLRRRIDFAPGQSVLVIGATGNAGRMAIGVARLLGASRVIGAGRDVAKRAELTALGADAVYGLDELAAAADVDVVIDYLWGESTARAMHDIVSAREDRSRPLTWVEVGAITGPDAAVPAAALRASRLQIVGSGVGSVTGRDYLAEAGALAAEIAAGRIDVRARRVPLADVEAAWVQDPSGEDRIVFVP